MSEQKIGDGWTDEQREEMRTSMMAEHPYGQDGKWVWNQACRCRRCYEEYERLLAEQKRVTGS